MITLTDKEKIASLELEVQDLKAQLAAALATIKCLSVKKTSKNSSLPPSHDIEKTKSLRTKSDRPSGGQPGHKGSNLKIVPTPDVVKELKPNFCKNCGGLLSHETMALKTKRQVVDLPAIAPVVTEYHQYQATCGCGAKTCTDFPSGVNTHIQYGKNIEALVGYLSVNQYVPYERMTHFLSNVCNVSLSQGTVDNMLQRLVNKAAPFYESIRDALENSKQAVGADETGCRVNGENHWAWVWQNVQYTYLTVSDNRGKKTVEATFPNGFPEAALSSDRWASHLNTNARVHQICLAHLLRELQYLEASEKHAFAIALQNLFKKAIQEKREYMAFPNGAPRSQGLEDSLDHLLGMPVDKGQCPKTHTLQKSLRKLRDCVFPFLYEEGLSADNNGSERAIRNFKVKIKISGMFKTGQQAYAKLKSLSETVKKQGQNTFEVFVNLAHCQYQAV